MGYRIESESRNRSGCSVTFAIFRDSGFGGARDLLSQLAVEPGGVDDEALVRAFGDGVDAVVGHDCEAELAAIDLLQLYADGHGHSRWRRGGMSEVDHGADALLVRPIEMGKDGQQAGPFQQPNHVARGQYLC